MASYNPKVIQEFASDLYKQARRIVVTTTIGYAFIGFVVGLVAVGWVRTQPGLSGIPGAVNWVIIGVAVLLFGFVGYSNGQAKAFALRLQAQIALCQVQIEKNTRNHPGGESAPLDYSEGPSL